MNRNARSHLKFGLLTNPLKSVADEIPKFKKLGFDYAEVGIEEPNATPQILTREKEAILAALARNSMFPLGHTAYWVGFGSSHENVRRGWVEEGKEMIHAASALGMDLLNFHFYSRLGMVGATEESKERFLGNFASSMAELAQFARHENITLMLENVPSENGRPLESIDSFSIVMEAVPGLGFHLDVAHAFIENRMKGVKAYLDTFGHKLVHIHMHDNHGKHDEHLPLGAGKIDFRKVVKLLKEINYSNTITFEVFTSHSDAVRSREFFKKQWNKLGP
jgi:sugar phosphate isomerase/epimerase